jgi:hypothetical protein
MNISMLTKQTNVPIVHNTVIIALLGQAPASCVPTDMIQLMEVRPASQDVLMDSTLILQEPALRV